MCESQCRVLHKKNLSSNEGVFSVCGFCHSALQFFKCVWWSVDTCASLSVLTTLGTAVLSSLQSSVVVDL